MCAESRNNLAVVLLLAFILALSGLVYFSADAAGEPCCAHETAEEGAPPDCPHCNLSALEENPSQPLAVHRDISRFSPLPPALPKDSGVSDGIFQPPERRSFPS